MVSKMPFGAALISTGSNGFSSSTWAGVSRWRLAEHLLVAPGSGVSFSAIACGADRLHRVCAQRLRLEDANSTEFNPATRHRIIYKLRELTGVEEMGGTMRLGAWACVLQERLAGRQGLRRTTEISERHRHRYEFNPRVRSVADGRWPAVERAPLPDATYVEIVRTPGHPTSWVASSTPNSNQGRWSRIRSSASSLPQVTATARSGCWTSPRPRRSCSRTSAPAIFT